MNDRRLDSPDASVDARSGPRLETSMCGLSGVGPGVLSTTG